MAQEELYCLCDDPNTDGRFMLRCPRCEHWFHPERPCLPEITARRCTKTGRWHGKKCVVCKGSAGPKLRHVPLKKVRFRCRDCSTTPGTATLTIPECRHVASCLSVGHKDGDVPSSGITTEWADPTTPRQRTWNRGHYKERDCPWKRQQDAAARAAVAAAQRTRPCPNFINCQGVGNSHGHRPPDGIRWPAPTTTYVCTLCL